MARTRDRHDRGIRGPLALPNAWTQRPAPFSRPSRQDFFADCVTESMTEIAEHCAEALTGVIIGVEEVPHHADRWSADRVPLAAAVEATATTRAQVVIYERPLEHRATSRASLARLVHHTIVEQLALLTGRSVYELAGDDFERD